VAYSHGKLSASISGMRSRRRSSLSTVARVAVAGVGLAAGAYAIYAATMWVRYGKPRVPRYHGDRDTLLDRFMPRFDVVERQRAFVRAPAAITLEAAKAMDLSRSGITRAIFKTRELLLGASAQDARPSAGLLVDVQRLGWGVLAERPDREVVLGAVTRPWEPNVTFRAIAPEDFASFDEPDYVKITWTLRADPLGDEASVFRTETRAVATDAEARRKFRLYWAAFSPGIFLIRWLSLGPLRRDAERQALARCRAADGIVRRGGQ
jgi:hypothetical protein